MTHTNSDDDKTDVAQGISEGFTFIHNRDPEDGNPYFKYLVCWHWIVPIKGPRFFPSLCLPRPGSADVRCQGQDFDGSEVGVIMDGPDRGCTILLVGPRNAQGQFCAPTYH